MDRIWSIVNSLHISKNAKFTPLYGRAPNIGVNIKS